MENKKDAVNIGITLSTQLISAALSMLTIIGAIVFFVLDKKQVNWVFFFVISIGFFSFIVSIYNGAKGIDKARKDGFNGVWNLSNTKRFFNKQAIFCFIGIAASVGSILMGKDKPNTIESELIQLNKLLRSKVTQTETSYDGQIEELKFEIKKLKYELEQIKKMELDTL